MFKDPNDLTVYYERNTEPGFVGIDTPSLTKLISFTYLWMVLGVLITFAAAFLVCKNDSLCHYILETKNTLVSLIVLQCLLVIAFTDINRTCSATIAFLMYIIYVTMTGLILSSIFIAFKLPNILEILAISAFTSAGLGIYGLVTKRNLGALGNFCIMGLFGMIGFFLAFQIVPSFYTGVAQLTWVAFCVIVFSGFMAFDSQELKKRLVAAKYMRSPLNGTVNEALNLYLNFLNPFLNLLSLTDSEK